MKEQESRCEDHIGSWEYKRGPVDEGGQPTYENQEVPGDRAITPTKR